MARTLYRPKRVMVGNGASYTVENGVVKRQGGAAYYSGRKKAPQGHTYTGVTARPTRYKVNSHKKRSSGSSGG